MCVCVDDNTLLMSGSDLLEHMVCSSLIKSVSSSEKTGRPPGSLKKQKNSKDILHQSKFIELFNKCNIALGCKVSRTSSTILLDQCCCWCKLLINKRQKHQPVAIWDEADIRARPRPCNHEYVWMTLWTKHQTVSPPKPQQHTFRDYADLYVNSIH